jgi:2-polyprenyl-3-methyl-5-hydroxy-6-metoxy-1,4-benzoquinol methylase
MPQPIERLYQYSPNLRSEVADFLPTQYHKVLEIGCSYGTFRQNLQLPNEYWGVEPNELVAMSARTNLDHVFTGLFEGILDQLPNQYFDLVICNDVIEHMADPDAFLESIKSKMTKNASLVGSIPNVRHISNLRSLLIHKDWQYEDAGILDRTHLKFFTEKSLKNLFALHRYRIEKINGINDISSRAFFPRIFAKLLYLILGGDIRYIQIGFRVKLA